MFSSIISLCIIFFSQKKKIMFLVHILAPPSPDIQLRYCGNCILLLFILRFRVKRDFPPVTNCGNTLAELYDTWLTILVKGSLVQKFSH